MRRRPAGSTRAVTRFPYPTLVRSLPATPGDRRGEILAALDRLQAGGSTNGGDGIRRAYAMAKQGYVEGGVNRGILATDGDCNVGTVDQGALETLVADQRKAGIEIGRAHV